MAAKVIGFNYFGPNSDGNSWARGLIYECSTHKRNHVVEFRPVIGPPLRADTLPAMESQPIGGLIWTRIRGETLDTITLLESIQQACCHCTITDGRVVP